MTQVKLPRTGTLRLALIFAGACLISGLMLLAVIDWRTEAFETTRIANFVLTEANAVARGSPQEIAWMIRTQASSGHVDVYHNTMISALFTPAGQLIAGNIDHVPGDLPADGQAHHITVAIGTGNATRLPVIAVARRLPDGTVLVLGRGVGILASLRDIVVGALLLAAIPCIIPALAAGIWLSRRAQRRVRAVNQSIERIMAGQIHERLPVGRTADEFDQLAISVNRMLDEMQRLLAEVQGVTDTVAHDLRTPLARIRSVLERGRTKATTQAELVQVAERAIAGLDQAQSIITALLRIGEFESGQRRAAFQDVDLNDVAMTAAELYAPVAEEKQITFTVVPVENIAVPVFGDRDLITEAVVNLLDNAIKFAPAGGAVRLVVAVTEDGPVLRVIDNGPGISPQERALVMTRFYRADKTRHVKGHGLGLSIVLAIVRLHDFDLVVEDAHPGCMFELRCHGRNRTLDVSVPASHVTPSWRRFLPWKAPLEAHA
ncbi:MAG TPA: ATP-binding protein [Rhodopila sp.]|nr:ATP-binding protein [Rhodopila sp.]